jgi:hypothetical protein
MRIRYSLRFLEGCREDKPVPPELALFVFFVWGLHGVRQRQKDADGDVSRN